MSVNETRFSYTYNMDLGLSAEENSDQTIRRILSSYEIGAKIRQLRLRKKIGLADLGSHTGLSASMLSQLENGKMIPTLGTLARIAMVFDVGVEYFFGSTGGKQVAVDRAGSRVRLPEPNGKPEPFYFFECLGFGAQSKSLSAYIADFPFREVGLPVAHAHDGSELIYVIRGVVRLQMAAEQLELAAGDSAFFDSSSPHSYQGISTEGSQAIIVTSPPRAI